MAIIANARTNKMVAFVFALLFLDEVGVQS
jgi:hypothetical protein